LHPIVAQHAAKCAAFPTAYFQVASFLQAAGNFVHEIAILFSTHAWDLEIIFISCDLPGVDFIEPGEQQILERMVMIWLVMLLYI
jgi:hypothetical protein